MERKPYHSAVAEEVSPDPSTDGPPQGRQASVVDEKTGIEETVHNVELDDVQGLANKLGDGQAGLAPVDDLEYVLDKIELLTIQDCRDYIEAFLDEMKWDYNISQAQKDKLTALLAGPLDGQSEAEWELEMKSEVAINKYYSPYPEVRAITTPTDDPDMACETIRAHLIGYLWAIIGQFINSFFLSRFPDIYIGSAAVQVLLYPTGKAAAAILPDWGFTYQGQRISLNPGPWTYKEQMLATIIMDVAIGSAYVFYNIQTQVVYYHDTWLTPAYQILLLLSTQMMGLGFAGLLRRFVIFPVQMFWPTLLPTIALNKALLLPERKEKIHGWSMSRYKFFWVVFIAYGLYFWFPDYLFESLAYFNWPTWISPDNFNLAVVAGSADLGLGYNPISSLDYNVFGTGYPLSVPFWAYAQNYGAMVLSGLVILAMYYGNYKWTAYLPINSSGIYDNKGKSYDIDSVIDSNGVLIESKYKAYSPAFYSAGNIMVYGSIFVYYPFTMVFVILDQWRPLKTAYIKVGHSFVDSLKGLKRGLAALAKGNFRECWASLGGGGSVYDGFDDPFTNLMRAYPEVPDWWFLSVAFISFILGIVVLSVYKELGTPVWTIFFVIGLNLVFLVPMSVLYATTGVEGGLNVITELIMGYALPGHPEALMFVKAFGYNINGQADNYITDQKMGFYAKIPPRAMYRGQMIASLIVCFVCYGVIQLVDGFPGICTAHQKAKFNCEDSSEIFFASSVIWGAIGPKRIFSQIYPALKYNFLLGFLLALVWWSAKRYGNNFRSATRRVLPRIIYTPLNAVVFTPLSYLYSIHPSVVLSGFTSWAPGNLMYYTGGMYMASYFMYYLKRYKTAWWEKYNYLLAAALSASIACMAVIIFFAVEYHEVDVNWWGNEVAFDGLDYSDARLKETLPAKGYFGPDTWH